MSPSKRLIVFVAARPRVTNMLAMLQPLIHDGRSTPGPRQKDVAVIRYPPDLRRTNPNVP